MKAVILAGGLGTRLTEETVTRPKPLVEVGGMPILWHIMKIYSAHGINEFIICAGYKGYMIKEYFANYFMHMSNVTFDMSTNEMEVHENYAEPWRVTIIDTGKHSMTGGRLRRIADYLGEDDFCLTYGDGVSNIDISQVIAHHRQSELLATVSAVQPPGRFGALDLDGNRVKGFVEKPHGDGGWINGGFFVMSPKVLDYIDGDDTVLETDPMEKLAKEGQLTAYKHSGFWHPMDTLRDKQYLDRLWQEKRAPWRVW